MWPSIAGCSSLTVLTISLSLSLVFWFCFWVPCISVGKICLEPRCPWYWPTRTIAIATICCHSVGAPPRAQWSEEQEQQQQQQQLPPGGGKGGPGSSPWPPRATTMMWCWPPKPCDSHHASARWVSELGFVLLMSSTINFCLVPSFSNFASGKNYWVCWERGWCIGYLERNRGSDNLVLCFRVFYVLEGRFLSHCASAQCYWVCWEIGRCIVCLERNRRFGRFESGWLLD